MECGAGEKYEALKKKRQKKKRLSSKLPEKQTEFWKKSTVFGILEVIEMTVWQHNSN